MFLILGSPRSGTTLLTETLQLHSDIIIPREGDFIGFICITVYRIGNEKEGKKIIKQFLAHSERSSHMLGEYLSPREIDKAVDGAPYSSSGIIESIYNAISQKNQGALIGDKTPNNMMYVDDLIKSYLFRDSEIKIIHLVRDIRGVVYSLMNANLLAFPDLLYPRTWMDRNMLLNDMYTRRHNHPDAFNQEMNNQYTILRYEDFLANPEETLRSLCTFLGVEFQEGMLSTNRSDRYSHDPAHTNLNKPFDLSRAEAWKHGLPQEMIDRTNNGARQGIEYFGYEL